MPAYRSPAEAEVRDAVVERLRIARPAARIIHEINVSIHGPNRIDVVAVDKAEIIAVEIKSAKDKLDRLEAQVSSMRGMAHTTIAAVHERFLVERVTNRAAKHYDRDGVPYLRSLPDDFPRAHETWVHPCVRRCIDSSFPDSMAAWRLPDMRLEVPLPETALDMLWHAELVRLCGNLQVQAGRRPTIGDMRRALRWNRSGKDITQGVCAALRARICPEADAPIESTLANA